MTAYYNEYDKDAAAWLRELIHAKHLPYGHVDERSIEDVEPEDLDGYTQVHLFAGIGGWPLALRLAGWPDDRPVWTASCPCQPFSQAGEGDGFDDPRHLYPALEWLIRQRLPPIVFGEQVASKAAEPWIDLVLSSLETMDYSGAAIAIPAAGVGAPNIRDRTFWVGHANFAGPQGHTWNESQAERHGGGAKRSTSSSSVPVRLAYADSAVSELLAWPRAGSNDAQATRPCRQLDRRDSLHRSKEPGPVNGFWQLADWLFGRDGKWRPVEPGTFPLADGIPARVVQLRGYGNAINPWAAKEFIETVMEYIQ